MEPVTLCGKTSTFRNMSQNQQKLKPNHQIIPFFQSNNLLRETNKIFPCSSLETKSVYCATSKSICKSCTCFFSADTFLWVFQSELLFAICKQDKRQFNTGIVVVLHGCDFIESVVFV